MDFTLKTNARNLIRDITRAWLNKVLHNLGIGAVWEFDATDTEIVNSWKN